MTIWVFVLLSVLSTILSYLGKDRVAEILAHTTFMFSLAVILSYIMVR